MYFVSKDECGLQNLAYMMRRRETRRQAVVDTFPFLREGENSLAKAIVLIGDKVVGKATANRTCIRSEGKLGVLSRGVPDQHFQNPAGTGFTGSLHRIRSDFTG